MTEIVAKRRQAQDGSFRVTKTSRPSTARRRRRTPDQTAVVTKVEDWLEYANLDEHIFLARHKDNSGWRAVKKIVEIDMRDDGSRKVHKEVEMLLALRDTPCERIVAMQCYCHDYPELNQTTLIFDYYPAGDVRHWRHGNFDTKNFKMVPESYIWRFFIQMAQALAFIHGVIGPYENRQSIIHRDIKPKNILVYYNGSTTYPSFKLHDFGCATFYSPDKEHHKTYCGSFAYQPPEAPRINTFAADIWSIGACVHFLCLSMAPHKSLTDFKATRKLPSNYLENYTSAEHWYSANVPREVTPINLTPGQQIAKDIPTRSATGFNHQYSDELNRWLRKTCHKQVHYRATHADLLKQMIPLGRSMIQQMTSGGGLADLACFGY